MLQQDALLPSRNGGMIVEATRPARKNLSLWTPNQPNKVWHDRRPVTVFLIALTATYSPYSFPHCLAERQFDRTLNQSNKVWHDRRPFTVFLIALTATFLSCSHCLGSAPP